MPVWYYLLAAAVGYLCGSVMFAGWIPKAIFHRDTVTPSDDQNPGVFNAFRYGGRLCGSVCLLCELAKGWLPVYLACRWLDPAQGLFCAALIGPVLGHAFPAFNRFRGGKCIAVSFGAMVGLFPHTLPFVALAGSYIFFSVLLVVDSHFWRSVLVYLVFSACVLVYEACPGIRLGCIAISLIVVVKHLMRSTTEPFGMRFVWHKPNQ